MLFPETHSVGCAQKWEKGALKKVCFFPCGKKGKWLFRGLKKGVFFFFMWKKKENGCFRANLTAVILKQSSGVSTAPGRYAPLVTAFNRGLSDQLTSSMPLSPQSRNVDCAKGRRRFRSQRMSQKSCSNCRMRSSRRFVLWTSTVECSSGLRKATECTAA